MKVEMDDVRLSAVGTKRGVLQRAILKILQEHERQDDGLPTSTRFIYYELIDQGVVIKKPEGGLVKGRRNDQDTCDACYHLRDVGVVPWDWITDETRTLHSWQYANTIAESLDDAIAGARLDCWDGEPPPMILTESRSLAGVLNTLAWQYLVPIAATNGQVGGFLHTDVAPALTPNQRLLYLGDFDWQGGQIEANTRSVLERLIGGELEWERLALTAAQVGRYHLTRIRKPDKRYKPVRYHDAVETEALKQNIIVSIVRRRLDALLPEPLADVQERERTERLKVQAQLRRLK